MANIPTYFPEEKKTALPNVFLPANASPDSFGAIQARQIAGGLSGAATIVEGVIGEIQKRKEKNRVKFAHAKARDTLTQAERRIDDTLFGDNGFYTRKGEQVENLIEDAQKEFDTIRRESLSGLTDEMAKELFSVSYDDFITRNLRSLSKHRANEIEKYNLATLDAQIAQDHDNAVKNRYDRENLDNKSKEIVINTLSKYAGLGEEVQSQAVKDALNLLHKDVIEGYLTDREFDAAKEYIDRFGDEIAEPMKRQYEEVIKQEQDNRYILEKADELSRSGKTIDDQLDAVAREKNPEIRKNLRSEVLTRFDIKNKLLDYRQTQTGINEWNKLFDMFDNGDIQGLSSYRPPTGKIDPSVNDALRRWRDNKLKSILNPTTKGHTLDYYKWKALPKEVRGAYSFDEMIKYSGLVTDSEFQEIFKEWRDIRETPDNVKNIITDKEYFNNAIKFNSELTPKSDEPKPKADKKNQKALRFFAQADKLVNALPEDKRNDMDEWEKIKNLLLRKIYPEMKGFWKNDEPIYYFELAYKEMRPSPEVFLQEENLPPIVLEHFNNNKPIQYEYRDNLGKYVYKVNLGDGTYNLYGEDNILIGNVSGGIYGE